MKTLITNSSVIALICMFIISMSACKKSNDAAPSSSVEGDWVFVMYSSTFTSTATTHTGSDGKFSFQVTVSGLGSCTCSGTIVSSGQLNDGKITSNNQVIGSISGSFNTSDWVGTGTFSIPGSMNGNWTAQKK